MPFEERGSAAKRIAVVGGGISGMGAAYHLSENAHVVLFESEPRLGGHARTIMAGKRGDQPVDTGFIVFNYQNYPHLSALFDTLGVPVIESNMSFGVSARGGRLEYALSSVDSVFAQRRNLARPAFLRMIGDILRFNREAGPAILGGSGLGVSRAGQGVDRGCQVLASGSGGGMRDAGGPVVSANVDRTAGDVLTWFKNQYSVV